MRTIFCMRTGLTAVVGLLLATGVLSNAHAQRDYGLSIRFHSGYGNIRYDSGGGYGYGQSHYNVHDDLAYQHQQAHEYLAQKHADDHYKLELQHERWHARNDSYGGDYGYDGAHARMHDRIDGQHDRAHYRLDNAHANVHDDLQFQHDSWHGDY